MQWAGRVRGDELDHHPLAVPEVGPRVVVDASRDDVAQHFVQPRVVETEVHEAWPRDLDLGDVGQIGRVQVVSELGRELTGVASGTPLRWRGPRSSTSHRVRPRGTLELDLAGGSTPSEVSEARTAAARSSLITR